MRPPSIVISRQPHAHAPRTILPPPHRSVKRPAVDSVDSTTTYYVGKSIILFTLFYTSMNWMYFRGIRKEIERDEKDRNSK